MFFHAAKHKDPKADKWKLNLNFNRCLKLHQRTDWNSINIMDVDEY